METVGVDGEITAHSQLHTVQYNRGVGGKKNCIRFAVLVQQGEAGVPNMDLKATLRYHGLDEIPKKTRHGDEELLTGYTVVRTDASGVAHFALQINALCSSHYHRNFVIRCRPYLLETCNDGCLYVDTVPICVKSRSSITPRNLINLRSGPQTRTTDSLALRKSQSFSQVATAMPLTISASADQVAESTDNTSEGATSKPPKPWPIPSSTMIRFVIPQVATFPGSIAPWTSALSQDETNVFNYFEGAERFDDIRDDGELL
jgi:hypothetical protein